MFFVVKKSFSFNLKRPGSADMTTITETLLTESTITDALDALATLRLDIFKEYPYLYQGRREDELAYLRSYAEKPEACVILASDGTEVIGAATGMPLIHEDAQLRDAFAGSGYPLESIYYVGELLLQPAYRSAGLGQKLLTQMERHIRSLGHFQQLTCATVERPDNHPLRPDDAIPISRFLARTGFVHLPGVTTRFTWRETDGVKREHTMQFWIKDLSAAAGA